MIKVRARCVCGRNEPFVSTWIERRFPGPRDILIDIAYAGICHSDIEHARSLRGATTYPLVPGHEIAGMVSAVGSEVTKFSVGDRVGVGNTIDSCRQCSSCHAHLEQYCTGGRVLTYNSRDRDGRLTQGGYSEKIVVDQDFVLRIPDAISLQNAAPLLCAGITVYSPLRHWQAGPGKRVAIVGFGGLGHLGVQVSCALGADTTVIDLSSAKQEDALRLGANAYHVATDTEALVALAGPFDRIISTVPADVNLDTYLGLLGVDGVLVMLALRSKPLSLLAASLLTNRRSLAGTRTGGLRETQEMLDFCASRGISAEVEVVGPDAIDEAYERLLAGDVRYRFVIDIGSMASCQAQTSLVSFG